MRSLDFSLPTITALLLVIGLVAVSSAASPFDFHKQVLGVLAGGALWYGTWKLGKERIYRLAPWLYGLSILLLGATLAVGRVVNGSRSWLAVGPLQFQPIEIAKLGLILLLAAVMRGGYRGLKSYLLPLAVFLPVLALVIKNDFGGGTVMVALFLAMLFVWRMPWWHLALVIAIGAVAFPLAVFPHLAPYQKARLTIFMDPLKHPLTTGYQTLQSMIAIGSGGVSGKGYAKGTQVHDGFVYSQFSDFIFASWSEEQGFIGATLLLLLFGALFWRMISMANQCPQLRDQLVITGILSQLAAQVIENVSASMSLLPLTGITLPLISYGLSSLLSILLALAVAYVVYHHRVEET